MKKILLMLSALISVSAFSQSTMANDELLTGDTRLACEAILCLSSGERPSECHPSLSRYFSISAKKFSDTVRKRKNFLKLCPASNNDDIQMKSLIDVQTIQKTECTANALNKITETINRQDNTKIRTIATVPSYCKALDKHQYTDLQLPKYKCDARYYSLDGWKRGYEKVNVSYREYRRWIEQGGQGSRTGGGRDNPTEYYNHIPVVKQCWF